MQTNRLIDRFINRLGLDNAEAHRFHFFCVEEIKPRAVQDLSWTELELLLEEFQEEDEIIE